MTIEKLRKIKQTSINQEIQLNFKFKILEKQQKLKNVHFCEKINFELQKMRNTSENYVQNLLFNILKNQGDQKSLENFIVENVQKVSEGF